MMEQPPIRIALGEYTPDIPPLANTGSSKALNALPIAAGYEGIGSLKALTGHGALTAIPRGAISGVDRAGNPFNFAGSATKIHRMKTTSPPTTPEDVTRLAGGAYNCAGECRWEFEIFDRYVIAVNSSDQTQVIDATVDLNFVKLGNATSTAPRAAHLGVIGTILILGNTFDSVNGLDQTAVHWCGLNDIFNWPAPGSEAAVAVQSDRQPLHSDGGAVQRIVSGAEVGAIFQERSVWRASYRGGDVVFDLDRVEPDRGLLIPAFAIPFGRQVFYLNSDGFYLFDYTTSSPVGQEKVNRTFLADVKSDYFHRCSAIPDPKSPRIWMAYPGAGSELQTDPGAPNKLLMYDWFHNQFTHGDEAIELLTTVVDAGVNLDSPHSTADPDTDGIDGAGLGSFDVRQASTGAQKIGGYPVDQSGTSWAISDFSGLQKSSTFETGRRELIPGRRSMATRARPLVDLVDPTVQAAAISRTNKTPVFGLESPIDEEGDAPLRVDGRYHVFRLNLPSGWDNALGMDVYAHDTGSR